MFGWARNVGFFPKQWLQIEPRLPIAPVTTYSYNYNFGCRMLNSVLFSVMIDFEIAHCTVICFVIRLATKWGKLSVVVVVAIVSGMMNQILHYLACLGYHAVSHKKNFPKIIFLEFFIPKKSFIDQACSDWLGIGLFFFSVCLLTWSPSWSISY